MNEHFYGDCDGIIRKKYFPDYAFKGTMVELGAGDPIRFSASKHFRENGWRCICIEPNPNFVELHKKEGNEIYQYACSYENIPSASFQVTDLHGGMSCSALSLKSSHTGGGIPATKTIQVEVKTLNTLLSEIGVEHIDLLCVDVEGWEIEVMRGFDVNKYNPKVISLEILISMGQIEYMKSIGYKMDANAPQNPIFIRQEPEEKE